MCSKLTGTEGFSGWAQAPGYKSICTWGEWISFYVIEEKKIGKREEKALHRLTEINVFPICDRLCNNIHISDEESGGSTFKALIHNCSVVPPFESRIHLSSHLSVLTGSLRSFPGCKFAGLTPPRERGPRPARQIWQQTSKSTKHKNWLMSFPSLIRAVINDCLLYWVVFWCIIYHWVYKTSISTDNKEKSRKSSVWSWNQQMYGKFIW